MRGMTKKERLELARRYESAWHYLYYQLPKWKQDSINEDPNGRESKELNKGVIKLGESDKKIPAPSRVGGDSKKS